MRNGYRIYDSDTHVNPSTDDLERYIDPDFRARLPELELYKQPSGPQVEGVPQRYTYSVGQLRYRRVLGEAEANPDHARQRINASGATRGGGANQKARVQLRIGGFGVSIAAQTAIGRFFLASLTCFYTKSSRIAPQGRPIYALFLVTPVGR